MGQMQDMNVFDSHQRRLGFDNHHNVKNARQEKHLVVANVGMKGLNGFWRSQFF